MMDVDSDVDSYANNFICVQRSDTQHVVKDPISLQCGHTICKSCLASASDSCIKNSISCSKCGHVTDSRVFTNTKQAAESSDMKLMIQYFLSNLYFEIKQKTIDEIDKFHKLLSSRNETIDVHFQYIQDEIQIRIESIKIQLDEIYLKFVNDLETIKKEFKECDYEKIDVNFDSKSKIFEDTYNELRKDVENKEIQTEQKLFQYQDNLNNLCAIVKKLEETPCVPQLTFKCSDEVVKEELIGEILVKNYSKDVLKIMKTKKFETVDLVSVPRDACPLPYNRLLLVNDNSISTYDANFKLLQTVNKINNKKLSPFGVAVSKRNEIYIADIHAHCVFMLDSNLNTIKQFGSQGTDSNSKFLLPHGLFCKDDYLYVCDTDNKRIQIYTLDLVYVDTMKLDYSPMSIKASDTTLAICGNCMYFYDIITKELKRMFKNVNGILSEVDSKFYAISYRPKLQIHCYNENGELQEEMWLHDKLDNYLTFFFDGYMLFFDKHLIITSFNHQKLLKFS